MRAKLKTYLFSYRYNGSDYGFEIRAYDQKEAAERLESMRISRYIGVKRFTLHIPRLFNWLFGIEDNP